MADLKSTALQTSTGDSPTTPHRSANYLVGIGASAGGLEAFTTFFQHMPPDTGLAFVLVQHLDPDKPSLLTDLLTSQTTMLVQTAIDQMPVLPNHVYIIPPNTTLTIEHGMILLAAPVKARGHRMPIDHFFQSLAADDGAHAIGIVLSGADTDGTLGLAAIQDAGGLTLAQTPSSARFATMPHSAIARHVVDQVLPVEEMPAYLIQYVAQPAGASPESPSLVLITPPIENGDALREICAILRSTTGHDFSEYKPTTLLRRIQRRMQIVHATDLAAYAAYMRQDQNESIELFQGLLISVTSFFRNPLVFDKLDETVIPALFQNKDAETPVRIWVAGCATGEEAYSIAMLLLEHIERSNSQTAIQLFATDIDEAALVVARQGRYDTASVAHLSPERLNRFFTHDNDNYQVVKALRELCIFSTHNLISDPPFVRMDLIVCRNLMIYFTTSLQQQLIPLLHYALAPGGYLLLGSAESVASYPELFSPIATSLRIFQHNEVFIRPTNPFPLSMPGQRLTRMHGTAQFAPPSGTHNIGMMLENILHEEYTPPTVVIDMQGRVVYFSGRISTYLTAPAGLPNLDIRAMVHPDIQMALHIAIRTAIKEKKTTIREGLTVITPLGLQRICLIVRPLVEHTIEAGLLVMFQEIGPAQPASRSSRAKRKAAVDARLAKQLEEELRSTHAVLESTIVELQEANTELTIANEELIAINEELQSANEELQTSKEEIQSINEELQTVNAELERKIAELDRVNADLVNFFDSTHIPAIFLHSDGRIARFTPAAIEVFRLLKADVGRPLSDIAARFQTSDILALSKQVLQTLTPYEEAVHRLQPEAWWMMRIRPYRTLMNNIDGVVITFTDITELTHAATELQETHTALERRVAERTRELATLNTALQAEIVDHRRSEEVRQQLLLQLVTAQEEERRRVARELHDQMGQDLTGLILGLKALQDVVTDTHVTERVRRLQVLAMQIGNEVRTLAVQLRPAVLDDLGLVVALTNYVERWSARALVSMDLHITGLDTIHLPLAVESTLYRLVQEALTNVLKHAEATGVSLIIERSAAEVRMIVEDNGIGFDVAAAQIASQTEQHLGLLGMEERVALLGGTIAIESALESGTAIFVRIPLDMGIGKE